METSPGYTRYPQPSSYKVKSRSPWMVPTLVLGCLMVAALLLYFVVSPYYALWMMKNAAQAKDGKTFATYIDFPVFKENLKAEFNAFMMSEMAKDEKLKDNPFSGFAVALAPTLVNNLVDSLVTPQGVERLMSGQFLPNNKTSTASATDNIFTSDNVSMGYESLNEFSLVMTTPDGKKTSLIFERHWIGDWKLSGIKLSKDSLPLALTRPTITTVDEAEPSTREPRAAPEPLTTPELSRENFVEFYRDEGRKMRWYYAKTGIEHRGSTVYLWTMKIWDKDGQKVGGFLSTGLDCDTGRMRFLATVDAQGKVYNDKSAWFPITEPSSNLMRQVCP